MRLIRNIWKYSSERSKTYEDLLAAAAYKPPRARGYRVSRGVYRDGQVYIMAQLCDTCIFRPGNLMHLRPGCVEQMVADCERRQTCIPCHKTLDAKGKAVCRGFYERHATAPLQIAQRLGYVKFVDLNSLAQGTRPRPAGGKP